MGKSEKLCRSYKFEKNLSMVHVLLRNEPLGYYIVEANIKPFELLHIQLEAVLVEPTVTLQAMYPVSPIITMLICETTQRANICFLVITTIFFSLVARLLGEPWPSMIAQAIAQAIFTPALHNYTYQPQKIRMSGCS